MFIYNFQYIVRAGPTIQRANVYCELHRDKSAKSDLSISRWDVDIVLHIQNKNAQIL